MDPSRLHMRILSRRQTWLKRFRAAGGLALVWLLSSWSACSSTQVQPLPVMPDAPPEYVQVPHPDGLDHADLLAIFADKDAPSLDSFKDCEKDFSQLKLKTQSKSELDEGARELVHQDPVRYHWCFYAKLLQLEEEVKNDAYLDERQKHVLDTFSFATPIARAFFAEYRDSRYLRCAVARYRKLSEFVFYRKVELSPQGAAELGGPMNPFGAYRPPAFRQAGVLEKYGIIVTPVASASVRPSVESLVQPPAKAEAEAAAAGPTGPVEPDNAIPAAETFEARDPAMDLDAPEAGAAPAGAPAVTPAAQAQAPDPAPKP